ncbi:MAG: lipid-A-disaccharide synthase [Bacteroidales bacterium]|nr:lipid-A-disaccharide synthase [Bacteroidales bacterium]HNW74721.1 lipid-A-disaccharide synthase [Bacteroidales bacterium]HPS50385.1 lipid-A-disaccharide synthase [Bacteroidales bacterium]
MRYYLIAGEASGDLHASNLMAALRKLDQETVFRCWGGDLMQAQGGYLVKHYRDLAFMGFLEVVAHLPTILGNLKICKTDLLSFCPDVLILIDYPGFNLRMAEFAHNRNIRVFYYISPQIWAWRSSRVHKITKSVEKMFVILPFERQFYLKYNYHVDYEGHPLMDVIFEGMKIRSRSDFFKENTLSEKPIIALLPGSRQMEILKMLRLMLRCVRHYPSHQFVIAGAPSIPVDFYRNIVGTDTIKIVTGQTYDLLSYAEAALVTSGTATLETALIGTPQVVCYKGNYLSYLIAKRLVHVTHISLVNLIYGGTLIPELIQTECNPENIARNLDKILDQGADRERIISGYQEIKKDLGGTGTSGRVAKKMVQYLSTKNS